MSKQVLDIEQMKHLKELGVYTSKASANEYIISETESYCGYSRSIVVIDGYIENYIEENKTFTLQDILDLLPTHISDNSGSINILNIEQQIQDCTRVWNISYLSTSSFIKIVSSINNEFIDAAYEMLCWCAENGYLKQMNHDTRRIP